MIEICNCNPGSLSRCTGNGFVYTAPTSPYLIIQAIDHSDLGVKAHYTEAFIDDDIEELSNQILSRNPEIIGFSLYLWNVQFQLNLAEKIHSKNPSIPLFAGGPSCEFFFEEEYNKIFKFVTIGFGESITVKGIKGVLNNTDINNIPNILTLENKPFFKKTPYSIEMFEEDTSYPSIYDNEEFQNILLNGTYRGVKPTSLYFDMSRGCPFRCAYCYEGKSSPHVYRRNVEKLKKDFISLLQYDLKEIIFLEATFNWDLEFFTEWVNFMASIPSELYCLKDKNKTRIISFEIKPELIDEIKFNIFKNLEHLPIVLEFGCGLQTSNEQVLKNINRTFNLEKWKKGVHYLTLLKNSFVHVDTIMGLPGETLESCIETINFTAAQYPDCIAIFLLEVIPGTDLYPLYKNKEGFKLFSENNYISRLVSTPTMTEEDINEVKFLCLTPGVLSTKENKGFLSKFLKDVEKTKYKGNLGLFLLELNKWIVKMGLPIRDRDNPIVSKYSRGTNHIYWKYFKFFINKWSNK